MSSPKANLEVLPRSIQFVLALGAVAMASGMHWKTGLVVGLGLALSSTAVSLQLLSERKELTTDYGRLGFAILLTQSVSELIKRLAFITGHRSEPFSDEGHKSDEEMLAEELAAEAEKKLAGAN